MREADPSHSATTPPRPEALLLRRVLGLTGIAAAMFLVTSGLFLSAIAALPLAVWLTGVDLRRALSVMRATLVVTLLAPLIFCLVLLPPLLLVAGDHPAAGTRAIRELYVLLLPIAFCAVAIFGLPSIALLTRRHTLGALELAALGAAAGTATSLVLFTARVGPSELLTTLALPFTLVASATGAVSGLAFRAVAGVQRRRS